MRVLLVLSLALNLLVAGLVLGDLLTHGRPGRGPRPVEMALGPLARALPEEDRAAILESLRDDPDLRAFRREEFSAGLAAIAEALRAEPLDESRLRAAFAAQADRAARGQQAVRDALIAHLAAMPPGTRTVVADRLVAPRHP
jgi:uncharacterized membrane protein